VFLFVHFILGKYS
jgi:hypothetical protein